MRGQGYDAEKQVSVAPFTQPQRQRLEALTAARKLSPNSPVHDWVYMAAFIERGRT